MTIDQNTGAERATAMTTVPVTAPHPTPTGGGGVIDLNLHGGVPTKKKFYPAPEFLPSNDARFQKNS